MPHPPDHCNKNKHGKSFGKSEDDHGNDIGGETRQNNSFTAIEIQDSSAQSTAQNESDGKGCKEKAGIGHAMIDCMKRKEGG